MYKKEFETFLKNLKPVVFNIEDYVNFNKIIKNIDKLKYELNIIDNHLKSPIIDFFNLFKNYPSLKKIIPLLIAVRNSEVITADKVYNFNENMSDSELLFAIKNINLFKMLEDKKITSITDYLIGLEVGMDTNARKNRTGTAMEETCENIFSKNNLFFYKQLSIKKIKSKLPNVNWEEIISLFSNNNANKIFDFLVIYNNKYYLTEVNFYASSGSKLNETAKSYILLDSLFEKYDNVEFLWITDGWGWLKTRNQIKEAYHKIKYLYNLKDFDIYTIEELFER